MGLQKWVNIFKLDSGRNVSKEGPTQIFCQDVGVLGAGKARESATQKKSSRASCVSIHSASAPAQSPSWRVLADSCIP